MRSKYIFIFFLSLLFMACSNKVQFPEPVSQKISGKSLTMNAPIFMKSPIAVDSLNTIVSDELLNQLIQMKSFYDQKSIDFDLKAMEEFWEYVNGKDGYFTSSGIKKWITATGFLLEITGEEKYAAAIEYIQYQPDYILENRKSDEIQSLLESYIFTRNNDFFHVNLFANVSVVFEHSLFGKIEITQETDFPRLGALNLKFKTEDKRYMEIFVRIPEWAEGTTVTVKNVKYFAPPGGYCQIAKQWREGDMVEIWLPIEKLPPYYR